METKVLINISDKELLNKLYEDIKSRIRPLYVSNKKELCDIVPDFEEGRDAIGKVLSATIIDDNLEVVVESDAEISKLKPFIAVTPKKEISEMEHQNITESYHDLKGFILGDDVYEE